MKRQIGAIVAVATIAHAGFAYGGAKNNSLTIALSEPIEGVNEYHAPSDEGQVHTRAVLDRLLSVDNAKVMPALATSWKQIDAKTWEFELQKNVKFHDGSAFDADDVVYTINWAADPKVNLRNKNRFSWIERAEKIGPTTVRLRTVEPDAITLLSLAMSVPMLPSDVHEKLENKQDFAWKPVGTGAYRAVSVDKNSGIVLVPNENYVHGNPSQPKATVGRVNIVTVPDEQARIARMMVGEVELTRV
ncbi:MAG: hypothetical protein K0Q70_1710, partial [Rhodospirillales bacterium]|nr:hypothetical protein [Rhodospirillales bacterium]